MSTIDSATFKKLMGSFAASVTVVTTIDDNHGMWGLTATAFTSVSLDPPLCLVCVGKKAGSLETLKNSKRFAVNMLTSEQESLSNNFASRSDDKFKDIGFSLGKETGCPLLDGALATMECTLVDVHGAGDHDILIGAINSCTVSGDGEPLVYWRGGYRTVASLSTSSKS